MTMLDHDLAERGDRLVAQFIDFLVVILAIILSAFLSSFSETIGGIVALFGLLFAIFYILCADDWRDSCTFWFIVCHLLHSLCRRIKGWAKLWEASYENMRNGCNIW